VALAQVGQAELAASAGVASPLHELVLRPEVAGTVLPDAIAREGDEVAAGEVLAALDPAVQAAAVELARMQAEDQLQVERAAAVVREMQVRLEQTQQLADQDAATRWEVRQAQVQLDLAQIDERIARRELELAGQRLVLEAARLEQMTLRAPFDGVVVSVEARGGQMVQPEDPILRFASLERLKVELHLPASLWDELDVGRSYRLMGGEPVEREVVGELTWIDPVLDPASGTFRAVLEVGNADGALPAGFTAWLMSDEPVADEEVVLLSNEVGPEGRP
jgi:RND family efflux transporter MFP subunit